MQTFGNTEWLFARAANKPIIDQSAGVFNVTGTAPREFIIPAIDWLRMIPSWVVLTTLSMAMFAICATTVLRSQAEMRASSLQKDNFESELLSVRGSNQALQRDIRKLTTDPSTIEVAARERLGMVKANDIVVTMESVQAFASVNRVPSVH